MAKSIEELRDIDLEVVKLPIDSVEPDPQNPNELPDDMMDTLKQDVKERGFVQPIVVRPLGEVEGEKRYMLIDGEHRWRVLRDLGFEVVPAVVDDLSESDAKIRNITMNRLRGQLVPIKLAFLLADLHKHISEEELTRRLGMDASEFKDTLRLANFTDDVAESVKSATQREEREAPEVLQFVLSKRDAKVVEDVLAKITDETTDRAAALVILARAYEKQ